MKIADSGQFFLRVGTNFEGASGRRYEGRFYDSKPIFVSPPQQCVDASYGEVPRKKILYVSHYVLVFDEHDLYLTLMEYGERA